MIVFRQKGDFSKTTRYLSKLKKGIKLGIFDKYGRKGVIALSSVTPIDTGNTANSWTYKVENKGDDIRISFYNTNIQNGVVIAILLQYGHATGNGGWVQGKDYINPAIHPIFDEMVKEVWEEVLKL